MSTAGELEDQIARAISRFHREQVGRGPQETKAKLVDDDLVVVRCKGTLSPADQRLLNRPDGQLAQTAFATLRQQAIAAGHEQLEAEMRSLLGRRLRRVVHDICVSEDEVLLLLFLQPKAAAE